MKRREKQKKKRRSDRDADRQTDPLAYAGSQENEMNRTRGTGR